jgi:Tfp pilus assembly protein PilN
MKRQISLLPKEEFEQTPIGKFLIWALSIGRWIIVLTEFIVICAFLSRFYLDRRIADLAEEISQKKAMVVSMAEFEQEFRSFQERLKTAEGLAANADQVWLLDLVSQTLPADVSLTSFSFDEGNLRLSALVLSQTGLNSFLTNLSQNPNFTQLNISKIAKEESGAGLKINLSAKVKKGGGENAI